MSYEEFTRRAGGDDQVVTATLTTLAERLGGDEAHDLAAQLPRDSEPLLAEPARR